MVIPPAGELWRKSPPGSYVLQSFANATVAPKGHPAIFAYGGLDVITATLADSWIVDAPMVVIDSLEWVSGTGIKTFTIKGPAGVQVFFVYAFTPPYYPYQLRFGGQGVHIPCGFVLQAAAAGDQVLNVHYRCPQGRGT